MGKAAKRKLLKHHKEQVKNAPKKTFSNNNLFIANIVAEKIGQWRNEYNSKVGLVTDILNNQGFSEFRISQQSLIDWDQTNFLSEIEGLHKINPSPDKKPFDHARKELFDSLCWLMIDENEYINRFSYENYLDVHKRGSNLIKKAAELLYYADGESGMRDPMIWGFIPSPWGRFLDNAFNGIGGWIS